MDKNNPYFQRLRFYKLIRGEYGGVWGSSGGGGSGLTGSGAANQIAFWTGATALSGSNQLQWDDTNRILMLLRSTSAAGSELGRIRFQGLDSSSAAYNYAQIFTTITDSSAGAAYGRIEIQAKKAGAAGGDLILTNNGLGIGGRGAGNDVNNFQNSPLHVRGASAVGDQNYVARISPVITGALSSVGLHGQTLVIERNDAAQNNDSIFLSFMGTSQVPSEIMIGKILGRATDINSGSWKGQLEFYTQNGSTLTQQLSIDHVGELRVPGDLLGTEDAAETSQPWERILAGTNVSVTEVANGEALSISAGSTASAIYEWDDFISGIAASGQIGKLGFVLSTTGTGTLATIAPISGRPGLIQASTGATSGSYSSIYAGNSNAILGTESFDITWLVRLDTNDANTISRIGVFSGLPAPTDGAYFEKLAADTDWFRVTRSGGVETRTDTGVAVSTNFVKMRLRRIDGSSIGFTIDSNAEQTNTSNLPTINLVIGVVVENNAAAAKTLTIDACGIIITGLTR